MKSTQPPKIRIGIVTRNREHILPEAIQSALKQDWPNLEVWVVDDASTDSTPSLVSQFPQVHWIRHEEIRGYRHARNHMMREPGADYFVSLDDDSWFLEEDALTLAMDLMKKRPRLGAVGFDILDSGHPERQGRGPSLPVDTFIGCGHLLRLEAVRDCGYYTEVPGAYGVEEKDLSLKMLENQWDVRMLPGVHVWHDKTMVSRDVTSQHRSGVCNDLAFALRRSPWWHLPSTLPFKVINHLIFSLKFGMQKHHQRAPFDQEVVQEEGPWCFVQPTLRGIVDFLKSIPQMVSVRQAVSARAWNSFRQRAHRPRPWIPLRPVHSVTVTITTRNRRSQLRDTLQILKHCVPPPDEILVCCDGCQDNSEVMIHEEFPEVRVFSNPTWKGSIPSRHHMILRASGDVIVSLDDDSYPVQTDFFARVLELFAARPDAAVFTFPQISDEFPETLTQIMPSTGNRAEVGSFTNSGAAIRREIYLRLPGYPALFQHAYEEPDYALQCVGAGYVVIHEPNLVIRHLYSLVARNERRTHQFHARNELWSVLIRCPWPYLPLIAIYRTIRQWFYSLSRGPAWLLEEPKWIFKAILGLPEVLKQRRPIPFRSYIRWMMRIRHPKLIQKTRKPKISPFIPETSSSPSE